jgi:hypothetical protein
MREELNAGGLIKIPKGYVQYFKESEIEMGVGLPKDLIESFEKVGKAQRSLPLSKAKEAQRHSSGVMTYLMEQISDILHRLSHHAEFGRSYSECVSPKVTSSINTLSRGKAFVEEHMDNVANNAEYKDINPIEFKGVLDKLLIEYSNLHKDIPVYNSIQWTAREAAISLGEQDFDRCLFCLNILDAELKTKKTFLVRSFMISRDLEGAVIEFDASDMMPVFDVRKKEFNLVS